MKKQIHSDVYVGIIMLLFTIAGFALILRMPEGADIFPKVLFGLFGVFSILILLKGINQTKVLDPEDNAKAMSLNEIKIPLIALSIVVIYSILIKIIGFFTATIVFIPSFMVFYRNKNIKTMLITIAGTIILVYLLFVKQLNVPFPKGILF